MKPEEIYALIGCEESQAVTIALRALGVQAFSCDTEPCSGGHPEWHLQMDVFKAIAGGELITQSGEAVYIKKWLLGIFFPPCTYITVSSNKWYKDQPPRASGALVGAERREAREKALRFVCDLMNCGIPHTAIENPIGVIGSRIFWYCGNEGPHRWEVFPKETIGGRKSDQIIQPWMFGHGETKATCLWTKNLPNLMWHKEANLFYDKTAVDGREQKVFAMSGKDRQKRRSKTYPLIAQAMAEQYVNHILSKN